MAYGDFKNLPRRTTADKVLRDKATLRDIAKNKKKVDHNIDLASMVYNFFDKTTLRRAFKSEVMPNQQLAEELHKPIIKKCEKRKVYSSFMNNILGVDLADMQLIKNFNKGFRFYCLLLTVVVNMRVLFPWKMKRVLQLLLLSCKY